MCTVDTIRLVVIGVGIAAIAIGIVGFYLTNQQSVENDYVSGINKIVYTRSQIINEFMSDLLPRLETKQLSIADGKSMVASRANFAKELHQQALDMNVPDRYRSSHPHIIQSLDYFARSIESTRDALQYTEDALQTSEQLQIPSSSVIGAIFAFGSLPDSPEMSDLRSKTDVARNAFNEAVQYLQKSEEELATFSSTSGIQLKDSSSGTVSPDQLEECRQLGIPAYACSEKEIFDKKTLLNTGK